METISITDIINIKKKIIVKNKNFFISLLLHRSVLLHKKTKLDYIYAFYTLKRYIETIEPDNINLL